jgi:hypothetical protein
MQTRRSNSRRPQPSGIRFATLLTVALTEACAAQPAKSAPAEIELPSTQIVRISREWQAVVEERGVRLEPSPVSVFTVRMTSTVDLGRGQPEARERLELVEALQMRDGRHFHCSAEASLHARARYGVHRGAPAVELSREAAQLVRKCEPPNFDEPIRRLPGQSSRFVLRNDELWPFTPTSEKRVYLPHD